MQLPQPMTATTVMMTMMLQDAAGCYYMVLHSHQSCQSPAHRFIFAPTLTALKYLNQASVACLHHAVSPKNYFRYLAETYFCVLAR